MHKNDSKKTFLFHKLHNAQGRLHEIQERCVNIKLRGYGSSGLKRHVLWA